MAITSLLPCTYCDITSLFIQTLLRNWKVNHFKSFWRVLIPNNDLDNSFFSFLYYYSFTVYKNMVQLSLYITFLLVLCETTWTKYLSIRLSGLF